MGIRRISDDEVRTGAPDTSYLATGIRENLVELMRSGPPYHSGFESAVVTPPGFIYDVNAYATFPAGGVTSSILTYHVGTIIPQYVTAMDIHLSGWCTISDAIHAFRIRLRNTWTATVYDFDVFNLLTAEGFISRICSGLTNGGYEISIFALRTTTGTPVQWYLRHVAAYFYVA